MRLVLTGCRIALKRSITAVICIALCLLLISAALAVMLITDGGSQRSVSIAVISDDDSPLLIPLVNSMVDSRFHGLATLTVLQRGESASGYAAVLTLPEGFWNGLMTGENRSPQLTINVSSPLEGLWVRQLAQSGARTLSSAQHAIGGLYAAMRADGLSDDEISKKIFDADLKMINDYLTRKGRFESVALSATGSVTAMEYYSASAASFVIFALLFLLFIPIWELRSFGGFARCRSRAFAAGLIDAVLISALLCFTAAAVLGRGALPLIRFETAAASLLTASLLLFFASVFPTAASCAAATAGLGLIQALFGGGLLPEALLPEALSFCCRILPLSLLRRLLCSAAYGAGFGDHVPAAIWVFALLAASVLLWRGEVRA